MEIDGGGHKPLILITGFGPFPGVPDNPSARLAARLAERLAAAGHTAMRHAVLPTSWSGVAETVPALLDDVRPDIALHLGISRSADRLRLERSAYNATSLKRDCTGALPAAAEIRLGGAPRLDSAAPVKDLAEHVNASGIAARPSLSAGRYLCNFLYYLSLEWTTRQTNGALSLFLHIPPTRAEGGTAEDDDLLMAAEAILQFLLSRPAALARHRTEAA